MPYAILSIDVHQEKLENMLLVTYLCSQCSTCIHLFLWWNAVDAHEVADVEQVAPPVLAARVSHVDLFGPHGAVTQVHVQVDKRHHHQHVRRRHSAGTHTLRYHYTTALFKQAVCSVDNDQFAKLTKRIKISR